MRKPKQYSMTIKQAMAIISSIDESESWRATDDVSFEAEFEFFAMCCEYCVDFRVAVKDGVVVCEVPSNSHGAETTSYELWKKDEDDRYEMLVALDKFQNGKIDYVNPEDFGDY